MFLLKKARLLMAVVLPHNRDQTWREEANCIGADLEIFFPEIPTNRSSQKAKAICKSCPVSLACLGGGLGPARRVR